jgi:hypothetical protein
MWDRKEKRSNGVIFISNPLKMKKLQHIYFLMLLAFVTTGNAQDKVALNGTWRGQSLCVDHSGACKDEQVVYRIKQEEGTTTVNIDADRIVDGKAVNMGALVFTYDKAKATLSSTAGKNLWQLTINGKQIDGVLLKDGSTIRKVSLKKDE